jgi:predicted esterase
LLGSRHKYQLIIGTSTSSTRPLLILLHGSGQDEQDMVRLRPSSLPNQLQSPCEAQFRGKKATPSFAGLPIGRSTKEAF